MDCLRVYTDADGQSHFEPVELDFPQTEFVPGRPALGLSAPYAATGVAFCRVPPNWGEDDWHPTPRRQVGLVLAGAAEIRTSDGERHRFSPGGVFLLEDTTGQGHNFRTAGAEVMVLLAWLDPPQ